MYRPRRDRRPIIVGVAVLLLAVAAVVTYVTTKDGGSNPSASGIASDVKKTIPVDGARLEAEVITPKGGGAHPLLVMPAAWNSTAGKYHPVALQFALSGYQVLAYTQRGFGGSTGLIDFAGAATQRDARDVITWALRNLDVDPHEVAMLGISYGAGISLLTAAHDPRVKAVAALSTWVNLAQSYDNENTPSIAALGGLIGSPALRPRFDSTLKQLQTRLEDAPATLGGQLHEMSPSRSPDSFISELNKNHPAIMIANGFQDGLFDPGQLIHFFDRLTTPKRLELAPGDHGGPERSALSGAPNQTIEDAQAWLDHYVRGVDNGIDTEDPIVVTDASTGTLHTYRQWPAKEERVWLSAPGGALPLDAKKSTWQASLRTGVDSGATSGPMQLVPSALYRPPQLAMSAINQADIFFWVGPDLGSGLLVSGTPSITLNLASTARDATVFVYLYDVTSTNIGTLVDVQPFTALNLKPDTARSVTIPLRPITWSVPAGDHLTIVVDTVDPRFQSLNPAGSRITISSTKQHPASFSTPVSGTS